MTEVLEWCEHRNIALSCGICLGKPRKTIEFIDESLFTENVRCKLCDSETRARPNLKTYRCKVCLFRSKKDEWPNYDLAGEGIGNKSRNGDRKKSSIQKTFLKNTWNFIGTG